MEKPIEKETIKKETFKESFQKLIYARMDYNSRDLVDTPEYKALREREIEISNMIEELLGPENVHLLCDLDEIDGKMEALSEEHAYKSGFREAIELKQVLSSLGVPDQGLMS